MGNFIDLVKTRRSVRSFDGNGIEPQLLNELKSYAEDSTNPYDIKVRFEFLDALLMDYQALLSQERRIM